MQIDNWLTAATYQETASCRYTAHWYAQWSPMVQNRGHSPWKRKTLAVFEKKILQKIYRPVKENELWRIRRNDKLEAIIKEENIVRFIKCQRI